MKQLAFQTKSLLHYAWHARSHYYVHAPFAFRLCTEVLYDRKHYDTYNVLSSLRGAQRNDQTEITFQPAGASANGITVNTTIASIARRYALSRKHAKLLYRLARYLKPNVILETGTGTGFSSAALALGNPFASVYTIDAVKELSEVAQRYHLQNEIKNISYITGNLDDVLHKTVNEIGLIDFVYLDANHTYDATIRYFNALVPFLSQKSCVVIDDVHWSAGMKKAWIELTQHPSVTLSMDLFRVGLLFTDPGLNREALRVYF